MQRYIVLVGEGETTTTEYILMASAKLRYVIVIKWFSMKGFINLSKQVIVLEKTSILTSKCVLLTITNIYSWITNNSETNISVNIEERFLPYHINNDVCSEAYYSTFLVLFSALVVIAITLDSRFKICILQREHKKATCGN